MHIESSSASPVNYSTLQATEISGIKHSFHSSFVSSVENSESRAPTDELCQEEVTNNNRVTLNGHLCSEPEIIGDRNGYVCSSTASNVDWVGDGLKSIDNKTYYNSCNIDGIIYNLHDHILIAFEGVESSPCKLQTFQDL